MPGMVSSAKVIPVWKGPHAKPVSLDTDPEISTMSAEIATRESSACAQATVGNAHSHTLHSAPFHRCLILVP
jgi:hypothetical protein